MTSRGARALGVALVAAAVAALGGWLLAAGVAGIAELSRPTRPPAGTAGVVEAGATVAALAAGAVLLWLGAGAVVALVDHLRPARTRGRAPGRTSVLTPALTRRLVAAALGAGIAAGTAAPATAATPPRVAAAAQAVDVDPGWSPTPVAPAPADLDPGWAPARPPEPVRTTAADLGALATAPRARAAAEDAVVVRRGDTLWALAARALPAGATDAQIAAEWPRWYAANRAVVGADPDHLEPGMRLVPPAAGTRP
jgi:nucleoid-associated protein YgaU